MAAEETIYRGYLISRVLALTHSRSLAVLGSSVMFALAHGYGVVGSVSTFLFGLVLGLCFLWGRSLPRLILAHWIYNLMLLYGYP